MDRLKQQIAFLVDADKLKSVSRRTPVIDGSRLENSAEHSWHLVLSAMVLREHLCEDCDLLRTLEMLAVHDLVEIDAGDTFAYDADAQLTKQAREHAAAERVFGLLPHDQAAKFRALWEEFEAQDTAEARFANALDRFQPLLQNSYAGGGSWKDHDVTLAQVMKRMSPIEHTMPEVWSTVVAIVETFAKSGLIRNP